MKHSTFLLSAIMAVVMMAMCPQRMWADKVAHAVYNSSNYTLTFYYDELDHSGDGTGYDRNSGTNAPGWWKKSLMSKVVFDESFKDARPTSCYGWFYDCGITDIQGIANLNTSEVTNMNSMFYRCYYLPTLDLSNFDTSKVTDMSYMFYN